jgi:two-component system response regulator YesN
VPEANREKLEKYLQRMNLVSFSKYTQKKSFPSSVRTPFELQNDFIEFLQVLYAPYCYSREKESIARTLRDYLDAHYTEEISLNDLARQYSYSPSHLIRSFHQAYGASPMQYLKKLRIEHASQLLLHSDATIQSVGEMVGLRIPSYFIRVFKQEIGITPAQYRMFYAEENGGSETP